MAADSGAALAPGARTPTRTRTSWPCFRRVWGATATRPPPYYVSVDSLGLPPDPERNGAAILLAVLSGYLRAGGNPPHSVAVTEDGRRLLKERGMA